MRGVSSIIRECFFVSAKNKDRDRARLYSDARYKVTYLIKRKDSRLLNAIQCCSKNIHIHTKKQNNIRV